MVIAETGDAILASWECMEHLINAYQIQNDTWSKLSNIYFLKYFSKFIIEVNYSLIWINEKIVLKKDKKQNTYNEVNDMVSDQMRILCNLPFGQSTQQWTNDLSQSVLGALSI